MGLCACGHTHPLRMIHAHVRNGPERYRVRWYVLLGFRFRQVNPQWFTADGWAELRKSYEEYEWLEREKEQLSVNMEALDRYPCVEPRG